MSNLVPNTAEPFKNLSKPYKSNADRIRSMSDEELAEFICYQIIDRNIGIPPETWFEWLKQEVTEHSTT